MNNRKQAVFILSHERADRVLTYEALCKCGYTGQIYILVDNEDTQAANYKKKYGNKVIIFDKTKAAEYVDACDNFKKRNSVIYARNYNFEIAKELGLTHFLQLDDDYSHFGWTLDNQGNYITSNVTTTSLDQIINACFDFLDQTGVESVAFAQGGDLIGGGDGGFLQAAREGKFKRKVMNSFFFRVDATVRFLGRGNDDVNTYVHYGNKGKLFITIPKVRLWQCETQKQSGGLTEMYLEAGTYVKSFYTVIIEPACAMITTMGVKHKRIHHMIKWNNTCPMILDQKYKKEIS